MGECTRPGIYKQVLQLRSQLASHEFNLLRKSLLSQTQSCKPALYNSTEKNADKKGSKLLHKCTG